MTGIHQILTSVGAAVGAEGFTDDLGLPEADRYVVLLVDGLGELLLRDHARQAPFLNGLDGIDGVVAGLPSTTSASLTSLGTGLEPGQHGMVGYTVRVPGTTQVLNTLDWKQPVDPLQWQPHRTVLERVAEAGVPTSVVNTARFEHSGLTRSSQRGVPFVGVANPWERLEAVCDQVEATGRAVVFTYESELDHTGHKHGCTSQQWRDVLEKIDGHVRDLRASLPSDTVLVVTADHGMVDLPDGGRIDLDANPALVEDVVVLAGEGRLRHVFTRSGAEREVAERWRAELDDSATVLLRDDTEQWFGPIAPAVRDRIGDVVVLAQGDTALMSPRLFPVELTLKGFHGGPTDAERRIPVLVAR